MADLSACAPSGVQELSLFFTYTVFAVIAELCKFAVAQYSRHPMTYFYSYWSAEAIYAALGFLAIHEVFRRVFENFKSLPWFKFLLPMVGLGMLAISALIPIVHRAVETAPFLEGIYSLQIAVRCLQIGVFFLIFFLARAFELGLPAICLWDRSRIRHCRCRHLVGYLGKDGPWIKISNVFSIRPHCGILYSGYGLAGVFYSP